MRAAILIAVSAIALAGCSASTVTIDDGRTVRAQIYRVPSNEGQVQFRMLDSVNALRQAAGVSPLQLNASLNAAAATHARDMSLQNRPWHFGSDGSSPIQRVQRAGYAKTLIGENISETYETELETLTAWMSDPTTRATMMDGNGQDMGFGWFQEQGGKIWWTLLVGGIGTLNVQDASPIAARPQG